MVEIRVRLEMEKKLSLTRKIDENYLGTAEKLGVGVTV
jgi:hypothetical protein